MFPRENCRQRSLR